MSSAEKLSYSMLLSSGSALLNDALKMAFKGDSWHRLFAASVIPFVASAIWYSSRTVVEVTDSEQALWLQMWLSAQTKALQRVRRLRLLSPADKSGRQNMDPYGRDSRHKNEEYEEKEGGRFAPPKLDFLPANYAAAWTWIGLWPVSIVSSVGEAGHPYMTREPGYTLTVWFAPWGCSVAKDILLQGRQLWLAKRAKKTEIWMYERHCHPLQFKVVTRPSRPLSTVIVENGIKDALIADTKQFLNAESWYIDKGIPYRRGILLHGPPGCGKSSLITALAGDLRLPIVFVQLNSENMDDQQVMEVLSEAPRDSIVLIEDIDCALRNSSPFTDRLLRQRGLATVTLSGLLNAIDGVGAQEGRLLFLTTNHIDRLDEALIRPGRVDIKFYLGKASKAAAGELFDQFFSSSLADGTFSTQVVAKARSAFIANVEDGKHSFATLQGVLMKARDDPLIVEEGMKELLEAPPEDRTKHCSHCRGAIGKCSCMHGCDAPEGSECNAVHFGVRCDNCEAIEFSGTRYKCKKCQGYDLCEECYNNGAHDLTHPFFSIARFGAKKVEIEPRNRTEPSSNDVRPSDEVSLLVPECP